jgi:hypothetical protein
MHSEHLKNVHPGWVAGGWLLGVAVASGLFLVLVGAGLVGSGGRAEGILVAGVVAIGFFVAGLFIGLRWAEAPILHGVFLTLVSVVIWFATEALVPAARGLGVGVSDPTLVLGLLLVQLTGAVIGGRVGRRSVLGRRTE